jgi:hypothetical protein
MRKAPIRTGALDMIRIHKSAVLVGVLKASAPVTQASLHASAPGPWALVAVATAAALAILISIALGVRILPEAVMLIGP